MLNDIITSMQDLSTEHRKLLQEFLNRPNGKEDFIKEMQRMYEERLRLELLFNSHPESK